jgi:phosphohistidine phosphatase
VELVLFRHGPAEEKDPTRWPDDERRPLTKSGRAETETAARGLVQVAGAIERIFTSPATRARASADLLEKAATSKHLVEWNELRPGESAAPVLQRLAAEVKRETRVAIVGHEPTLSEFVGFALTGDATSLIRLAKAGGAALEFPARIAPGAGTLDWLITRKQLVRLAKERR